MTHATNFLGTGFLGTGFLSQRPARAQPEGEAEATPARRARGPRLTGEIRPDEFGFDQARHLLWRAGFGGTTAQIATLASWGPEDAVDYLLEYDDIPFENDSGSDFDPDIIRPLSAEERRMVARARASSDEEVLARVRVARQMRERDDRQQMAQIQKWWLRRMIQTPRPLEEKMTLFWHGHFAASYRGVQNSYHMLAQNATFRANATTSFAELLHAIIRDPAMLAFLNNNTSRKGSPNENLAREIMELFSLGEGNYSEQDIKEGARALTGYTFNDDRFIFDERNHDDGRKTILGRSGNLGGDEFVGAILASRDCGPYIVRKLWNFFVSDLPADDRGLDSDTRSLLRTLSSTLTMNDYRLRPVLRRMFLSRAFYAPDVMAQQIKSPVVLVVGAIRSLQTPVRDLSTLSDAMELMGQDIFLPPSVKGWDGGRAWINTATLMVRQNIMNYLILGKTAGGYDPLASRQVYDTERLIGEIARVRAERGETGELDAQAFARDLLVLMLGRTPEEGVRALTELAASRGNRMDRDVILGMLLLAGSMPEYQLC
ncbi:MAG: DUF1800 domain-containing protein [Phycisphaerales bacterium]|jgi:uncharacterized protein (DUF1800 family)|nr:DUF1800 domain-containing protein [Phycisphaerales bacterium]